MRGPFQPAIGEPHVAKRLVLLDGEGLGHKAESASGVSTTITKRFADVDLIVLVNSSDQPMQAAPISLLRAVGSAGYADKLVVVFSKFGQVKGDNLSAWQRSTAYAALYMVLFMSS